MRIVQDANILLRLADRMSPQFAVADAAVNELVLRSDKPVLVNQSCFVFWVVATRPVANNGLGLTPTKADLWLDKFLARFPLLEDQPGLFGQWRKLVRTYGVSGKPAHDARYVAAMATYGLAHILTFNVADFARFPGIVALDPAAIAAGVP